MKNKSDTRSIIKSYYQFVLTQFGYKIKRLRNDNGQEFHMPKFYFEHDIIHPTFCVDTPKQNGVVDRKH